MILKIKTMSKMGACKLWPMGQFHPQPVLQINFDWNRAMPVCFCTVYGCFCATIAVLTIWPTTQKTFTIWPYTKKFADPWHGTSMHIQTIPSE